jgi:hypothetical protein
VNVSRSAVHRVAGVVSDLAAKLAWFATAACFASLLFVRSEAIPLLWISIVLFGSTVGCGVVADCTAPTETEPVDDDAEWEADR